MVEAGPSPCLNCTLINRTAKSAAENGERTKENEKKKSPLPITFKNILSLVVTDDLVTSHM